MRERQVGARQRSPSRNEHARQITAGAYSNCRAFLNVRENSPCPPFWGARGRLKDEYLVKAEQGSSSIDMYNNDVGKKSAINL